MLERVLRRDRAIISRHGAGGRALDLCVETQSLNIRFELASFDFDVSGLDDRPPLHPRGLALLWVNAGGRMSRVVLRGETPGQHNWEGRDAWKK